jgi:glutathione S-transferase
MSNIIIYGTPFGSSFRPHWMLAELGLSYETAKLDMKAGEHKQPAYLAINPAGQVPAMVHDGFVVTESAAIVQYLAEKYDPSFFGPNTPESHATMMRWQLFVLLNLNKPFTALASKTWGMPATPEAEAKALEDAGKSLPVLEGWLAKNDYLAGDTFTVADIVGRSTFNYAEAAEVDLSAYPAILAWMKRCADRPAYQKAKGN